MKTDDCRYVESLESSEVTEPLRKNLTRSNKGKTSKSTVIQRREVSLHTTVNNGHPNKLQTKGGISYSGRFRP